MQTALSSRLANRLTTEGIRTVRCSIAATMSTYPSGYEPSIGADFNAIQLNAYKALGCRPFSLREADVDLVADMVCTAIMDA